MNILDPWGPFRFPLTVSNDINCCQNCQMTNFEEQSSKPCWKKIAYRSAIILSSLDVKIQRTVATLYMGGSFFRPLPSLFLTILPHFFLAKCTLFFVISCLEKKARVRNFISTPKIGCYFLGDSCYAMIEVLMRRQRCSHAKIEEQDGTSILA